MIRDVLTGLVAQAAAAAGYADSPVTLEPCVATNNPEHGDYQSNYAFRLGKALRTNPRAVAEAMVAALPENDLVAAAEVAGPGFINFRVTDTALAREVVRQSLDVHGGIPQTGAGRTAVIDFSSPNIAKRMHVGHLRSTVIGDALHRIYEALGWTVIADNHVGDWGTPFGKLIVAWHRWRDEAAYATDAIAELQRLYQHFGVAADSEPELVDQARAETAKLQAGDAENLALWAEFVSASMREFDAIYRRMDIHFDVALGESAYRDELQDLVTELLASGVAVESEGAVVIPFDETDGKGLKNQPMMVRKSDGAALYGTTDIATIRHRTRTWDPALCIYVVDIRQAGHFRQLFAAARKLGFQSELVHVGFGMLKFGGAVASTRSGGTVNLVDVLDEARQRALDVVEEKSGDLDAAEKLAIAETVALGAVKYFDLSQNPQSDITFDWERSLALNGNTAPYLMYAHARCCSVQRRAGVAVNVSDLQITHPMERELCMLLSRFPEAVELAAQGYKPNVVADYLYQIATTFGRFWDQCHVIGTPEQASRLAMTQATAAVLARGLGLLGIGAPERM